MKEELEQIEKNKTWELVPRPNYKNIIGTKWVFRNKMNEQGEVVRNKERLVCKGYSQQEGIDQEETYALVARIDVVRLFLAYAKQKTFKVYQMDVKSTFLNGKLEEEVYIEQPEGFPLIDDKDIVCRLRKELYGLKQAPRTWYERLDKNLIKLRYRKGMVDSNLYQKEIDDGLIILVIFVDDIIFGGNDEESEKFVEEMKKEFEMSMIGDMKYFLGLQRVQNKEGIFISQTQYLKDLLKRFGLETCKPIGTPMVTRHKLCKGNQTPGKLEPQPLKPDDLFAQCDQ